MSVQEVSRRAGPFKGDGSTKEFSFHFKVFNADNVAVYVSDEDDGDVQLTQGYTVELNADQDALPGGTVILTDPLSEGQRLSILSCVPYDQPMVLTNQGGFYPRTINDSADRLAIQVQQLLEEMKRTLKVPATSSMTPWGLLLQIFQAAESAATSAEEAEKYAQICEEIKEYVEVYSWDIPHLVDSLRDVENYPYDGFFVVGGYGNPGHKGQNISNRYVKAEGSTELRTLGERFADIVNVKDFGAKGDGVTDDTAAFNAAGETGKAVYVPGGTYRLSNPYDVAPAYRYFGEGKLVFTVAEQRRRGGSSGGVDFPERYTILYLFENQSDVSVSFDGVPQEITWVSATTVEAPGSAFGVDVRIKTANGVRYLSSEPESIRAFTCLTSGGGKSAVYDDAPGTAGVGGYNVSLGPFSLRDVTSGKNNVGVGSQALMTVTTGENNVAIGFNALYRTNGSQNTGIGSIAGEHLTTGSGNTLFGALAGKHLTTAENSTAIGYDALGEDRSGTLNTAIGYRALGNTGRSQNLQMSTAIGAFAGDFAYGNFNTFVGYRAGNGDAESYSDGSENVALGYMAMRNHKGADKNVVIGVSACMNITNQQENTVVGYGAGTDIGGNKAVVVGSGAGTKVGSGTVAIGNEAAKICESSNCVIVGNTAGINLTTGLNNTFVGANSGRFDYEGSPTETVSNCTAIGENARVDGDNQVQLGNAATTVYAYGAVQSRSDERDKADIQDTSLGLDFILKLHPVDYRWDYRDDYVSFENVLDENGNGIVKAKIHAKDGSKKRTRFHHGFIAQDIEALIKETGIDFGGYQDHLINGGGDVKSLGYEEFIAPMVKAIQELSSRVEALEKRMTIVEAQ